jgi:hypothetical protein
MRFEGKVHEKMREKYFKDPPGWILGTIKTELKLSDTTGSPSLDELCDHRDTTLAYCRQNRGQ